MQHLVEDLNLIDFIMPDPTPVLNDNNSCVIWSQSNTTKGLRHVQIRKNAIWESINAGFITVHHVEGAINMADLFTKEEKSVEHFITIRNQIMTDVSQDTQIKDFGSRGVSE